SCSPRRGRCVATRCCWNPARRGWRSARSCRADGWNLRLADEQIARGIRLSFGVNRVLSQASTPHQELTLIENDQFGRVLLLDGVTQVATADEFIYHEMLAHVPLFAHGEARDVLIVGGGDC